MEKSTARRIELTMFKLHPEVKPLYTALKKLCNDQPPTLSALRKAYTKRDDAKQKLLEIIIDTGRFMKMKWVEDKLADLGDVNVSSLLNQMKKEGLLISYTPTGSRKNYYWGLPEWATSDGKPKVERHYSLKFNNYEKYPFESN